MKNLHYLFIAGFVSVVFTTSLSFIYNSHWVGFFSGLVIVIILLVLMLWQAQKIIASTGIKKTILSILSILVILQIYTSVFDWIKSENQHQILTEIRQTIDGSIAQMEAEEILIKSLRLKHQNEELTSLEDAFRSIAGDSLKENGTLIPKDGSDGGELNFITEIESPDSIVIYIVADIARGNDQEFLNYDEKVGKYQGMATLTSNGVRYVRQN